MMRCTKSTLLGLLLLCAVTVAGSLDLHAQFKRRDITTFTAAERLQLRQLIMQWITTSAPTPMAKHLAVIGPLPTGVHCQVTSFLTWHRTFLDELETWLMGQPNGSKYVPLPKWSPTTMIPAEFYNGLVSPGSAVAPGYAALTNQTPNIGNYNFTRFTNPSTICNYTAGNQARFCMGGGSYTSFGTAMDNFARDLEREHNPVHGNIGGVMNTGASPAAAIFFLWHAYVDDIYQYYLCRCTSTWKASDLYIKDNNADVGDEPNATTTIYYQSPEIWVRNVADPFVGGRYSNEDNPNRHQNPLYRVSGQPNYVYVRIRNRGCNSTPASTIRLRVYWSRATTGLNWPNDWTIPPGGSEITAAAVFVPALNPGQTWTAQVPWVVPNPTTTNHFCLLARLVSTLDPMTFPEGLNVNTNTRNNNNIAWKNTTVVRQNPFCAWCPIRWDAVDVRAVNAGATVRLQLNFPPEDGGFLRPHIDLGQQLFSIWQESGRQGQGVTQVGGTVLRVDLPNAYIGGLSLPTGQTYTLGVRFQTQYNESGGTPPAYYGTSTHLAITQYERIQGSTTEQVTGGEYYDVRWEMTEEVPCNSIIQNALVQPSSCPNSSDGRINLVPSGVPPYTYWWSNGASSANNINLKPGEYTVIVRDANHCIETKTYTVGTSSTLNVNLDSHNPSCDNNNGSAYAHVSGGVAPYSYQWYFENSPLLGKTGPAMTDMHFGQYSVQVTDAVGCSFRQFINFTNDFMGMQLVMTVSNASSPTSADGAVNLTVGDGMPPFTYQWSNGATTEDINGLLPGEYSVTVTDMMGCVAYATATVGVTSSSKNLGSASSPNAELSILSVVPNPVADLADVQYTLTVAAAVRVEVYDALGKLVLAYEQGEKPAGRNSAWITTSELAPGRYSCRMIYKGGVSAVPFVVVR